MYLLANVFVIIAPFIPPSKAQSGDDYPYFVMPLVDTGLLFMGVIYWGLRYKLLPYLGGYHIEPELHRDMNGCDYNVYRKVFIKKQS